MWFILSKAIHIAAKTSFLFFNSSTVEPHGAVPESAEYEKIQTMQSLNQASTGKAQILNTFSVSFETLSTLFIIVLFWFIFIKKSFVS